MRCQCSLSACIRIPGRHLVNYEAFSGVIVNRSQSNRREDPSMQSITVVLRNIEVTQPHHGLFAQLPAVVPPSCSAAKLQRLLLFFVCSAYNGCCTGLLAAGCCLNMAPPSLLRGCKHVAEGQMFRPALATPKPVSKPYQLQSAAKATPNIGYVPCRSTNK